jgi:ferric-dicitrate binding protein FerR (iron transport regulator)
MSADDRDPFDAYHDSLSGPDIATTTRLEERLDVYLEHGQRRARNRLLLRVALVAVGCTAVAAAIVLWPASSDDAPAMIVADGAPQEVKLAAGGTVIVPDSGRIRVLQNDAKGVLIELDTGSAEVHSEAKEGARARVQVGTFEVEALGPAQVRVRKTSSQPEVTVLAGKAVLTGPNLPAAGVEITPADE